jgi:hypothetical protein
MVWLLLLTLLLGAGCTSPATPPNWDAEMSAALSARGQELAEQGKPEAGRSLAEEALALARQCGAISAQSRALALLAWIDRSYVQAEEALELLDGDPHEPEFWDLQLLLAGLALEQQMTQESEGAEWVSRALGHAREVIGPASETSDLALRAEYEGSARHLAATALRRLGQPGRAAVHERQAALVLTLLPKKELPALRQAVAQARGDDLARDAEFEPAFEQHALAENLARELGDEAAELAAMAGRSGDLAGLGRLRDAAQTASTLARLALSRQVIDLARSSAQRGLAWLDAADPFGFQSLRRDLLDTLNAVDEALGHSASSVP